MVISAFTSRLTTYFSRHGFGATVHRVGVALRRALLSNRQIVFYCDLASQVPSQEATPAFLRVERKRSYGEMNPQDLQAMIEFWNPKLARRNIEERFSKGASLWLVRSSEKLAGYGWTLRGGTIAPYYFPLAADDVQFFDFHVFPKFRGRAIDWFLMVQILQTVAGERTGRAFAEAGEWNRASLSSLAMTPFRRLGSVRKYTLLGKHIIWWNADKSVEPVKRTKASASAQATQPAESHVPDTIVYSRD
jgi:hypothetical protein